MSGQFAKAVIAAFVSLSVFGSAWGAEFCVSCSGPDASYRCEVGSNGSADARAWLVCITELAKQGGHDSCSVDRNAPVPCPGLHKVLTAPEGAAPPLPPVEHAAPVPQPTPLQPPPQQPPPHAAMTPDEADPLEPDKKRVPQTMQELAGDTYAASKEGLKNAGQSVGNTAKKAGGAVTDTAKAAGNGLSKAGNAVGNAAKKTWNCVTSLFQSC